jgi:Poxvirus D5 protein-like
MNVIQAIDSLRNDLDRTIESLEALRNGFGTFALVAPVRVAQPVELDPRAKVRVKQFVDECLDTKERAFLRGSSLWNAYIRWCKFNDNKPVSPRQFKSRLEAAGFRYSRSRRIAGVQARTWEGVTLRKRRVTVQ